MSTDLSASFNEQYMNINTKMKKYVYFSVSYFSAALIFIQNLPLIYCTDDLCGSRIYRKRRTSS